MERLAIFADVQNIYYTTRDAFGKPFDYRSLHTTLSREAEIVCAYAYAIDRGDTQQQKFQSAMRHIGFEIKLKPFIQRADGSAKGDWDVGITIDVLETAKDVDRVVLLSGDGDFAILLEHIARAYSCKSTVYSVLNLTAKSLIDVATNHVAIDSSHLI
ncbi:NYN domain-containing protein [Ningiella sp. W23]|uniref:LabA-like NYN domain-containing protein n=1 Tax=Ningiella sp. W23 TaxID=3023715 RepID=UPI003758093D